MAPAQAVGGLGGRHPPSGDAARHRDALERQPVAAAGPRRVRGPGIPQDHLDGGLRRVQAAPQHLPGGGGRPRVPARGGRHGRRAPRGPGGRAGERAQDGLRGAAPGGGLGPGGGAVRGGEGVGGLVGRRGRARVSRGGGEARDTGVRRDCGRLLDLKRELIEIRDTFVPLVLPNGVSNG